MKLTELFDTKTKNVNVNRRLKPIKVDSVNHGFYSNVYDTKDPFVVKKISREPHQLTYDAYWIYIDELVKHPEYKENPFFPRLYDVRKYKDSNKDYMFKAEMEKLIPYYEIDGDILNSYLRTLVSKDYRDKFLTDSKTSIENFKEFCSKLNFNSSFIMNEDFRKALKFVKMVAEINYLQPDIHRNNVMFRRIPYGIQLVITDPLK